MQAALHEELEGLRAQLASLQKRAPETPITPTPRNEGLPESKLSEPKETQKKIPTRVAPSTKSEKPPGDNKIGKNGDDEANMLFVLIFKTMIQIFNQRFLLES